MGANGRQFVVARNHLKQALLICDRLRAGLYRAHIERDLAALPVPDRPTRP